MKCIFVISHNLLTFHNHQACLTLVNRGDPVLVQTPAYPGLFPILRSLDCDIVGRSIP